MKEKKCIHLLVKVIYLFFVLIITSLIIIKSIDYINPDFNKGFLIDKKHIFNFYKIALYIHMVSAPIAIITGMFQFMFLKNRIHKPIGIVYMFCILFFAAPSALFMSFYAIGGTINTINFMALSILWFSYTFIALKKILKKDIEKHIEYIIASFILTNSAILLRLFIYINNQTEYFSYKKGYVLCSILSWLPFLLVYQFFFKSSIAKKLN